MDDIINKIKKDLKIQVLNDEKTLKEYSTDASIFEIKPKAIITPKTTKDITKLINFINNNLPKNLSLTCRSAGTDMTGAPLTESIVLDLKFLNKIKNLDINSATVGPGLFYKDLEKRMDKLQVFFPTFPASKSLCAIGGILANNAGGEKSIVYGKTYDHIDYIKAIMSNGKEYKFKKLNKSQLKSKLAQKDFEGQLYNKIYNLIIRNLSIINKAKPFIEKNSAGYYLWRVYDRENETFDLSQLLIGSQGTLGIITEAKLKLTKKKNHSRLTVCLLNNTKELADFVPHALTHNPESLETFDKKTMMLGFKFMPEIAKKLNTSYISLMWSFKKEALISLTHGIPKYVVLVELTDNDEKKLNDRLQLLHDDFKENKISHLVMKDEKSGEKYWTIRRESFTLLRKKVKNKRTAPFIDDFAISPQKLPEFMPQLEKILKNHDVPLVLFGHAGSGNFHIIPLMDLTKESERAKIPIVSEKVYDLVLKYKGTITAEHNDGLIRGPYLKKMFGAKMHSLFLQTKNIFDPNNIFNPGKKAQANMEYAMKHIKTHL